MNLKPHEIRFAGRKGTPRDPRREKLLDFRGQSIVRYDRECKYSRAIWNRKNRRRADHAIKTARDFDDVDIVSLRKTEGWWTH
ncbi:hypothetical protein [Thermoactinomyces vulgaris]|jgi:hypothetical protein|uniref:hypothetical protein n=1 Tax=Thermoactinomyces vulgaris TaxID=2026 RepID=UPI003624D705